MKYQILDQRFVYTWKNALSSIKWEEMEGFLKSGLFEVCPEWFKTQCASQLALGKVALVKGLLSRFKCFFDCRDLTLDDLAFEAFTIANEAGPEYRGVAAAIGQQFARASDDQKVFYTPKVQFLSELKEAYPWTLDIYSHEDFESRIRERFTEATDEPYDFNVAEVNAKMEAVERKYRELATAATETRKQQIALAVQDALLLGQPIRLEI